MAKSEQNFGITLTILSDESNKEEPSLPSPSKVTDPFEVSVGLTSDEASASLEKYGRNELENKTKPKVGILNTDF